ncbi:MAG: type I-E CRISPR-associated protein Cas6/Cse3/CasE [Armatimonadota bacterium]
MYLSMLQLNPRCKQVQSEIYDPYQMHRTLCKAFGDDEESWKNARVLFRVDETNGGCKLCALVQSKLRPDWTKLTVPGNYQVDEPKLKEVQFALETGQRLGFRLRANPTVKRDGKREGLYKEEEQYEWLRKKGEHGGFTVLNAIARADGKQKSLTAKGKDAVLLSVIFEGILQITDPELFLKTLESGIGSAKGFGFGLLSIAPVR